MKTQMVKNSGVLMVYCTEKAALRTSKRMDQHIGIKMGCSIVKMGQQYKERLGVSNIISMAKDIVQMAQPLFLLMALASAVIPWIETLTQLYVSQIFSGFGRGLVFPLLMSFSVAGMLPGTKATAMGVFQSLYALGMFAGPVAVGAIADAVGLDAGFGLCGLCGLLGGLIAWRYVGAEN